MLPAPILGALLVLYPPHTMPFFRIISSEDSDPPRQRGIGYIAIRLALGLLLGLLAIALSHALVLDKQVREQFDGKRWELPARVYARPLELYQGLDLKPAQLQAELTSLGYRTVKEPTEPGTYAVTGNEVRIVTRAFTFWDGDEPSRAVRVSFSGNSVQTLIDPTNNSPLGVIRLDPPVIGGIYPTKAEDRILVRLSEVPPLLTKLLISTEDRHFYEHHGIDPIAIVRAFVSNLRAGATVQGGSTLTQQLVKNFYLQKERSLARKAKEAVMALELDLHYRKDEILEAYLNEIYLGQDGDRAIHGFGLASWFYFGRPLEELEPPQLALLVGLARGASYYDPRKHPERATDRRNLVLAQLVETGGMGEEDMRRYQGTPLGVIARPRRGSSPYPAFLDLVRRQLARDYHEEDLRSEGLQIFTTLNPFVQEAADAALDNRARLLERQRHLPAGKLEGAIIVTGRDSGEVQAVVGGREAHFAGFNRALDALRQVGSTMKPVVYLTALAHGNPYHLLTPLDDSSLSVPVSGSKPWEPKNYDHQYHGSVSLRTALAHSYNLATVRLGLAVGVKEVLTMLNHLGLTRSLDPYPSLFLGGVSLTPMEIATIYQTIGAEGFRMPLRAIRAVLTAKGIPLQHYPLEVQRAVDPGAVFLLTNALQEVVRSGTGRPLLSKLSATLNLAGKTGTTDELRDSWFSGFSGDRVAVVWLGRDDNQPAGFSGAQGAMMVWMDLMVGLQPRPLQPTPPPNIEYAWVSPRGQQVESYCEGAVRVPFLLNSLPPLAGGGCGIEMPAPAIPAVSGDDNP
ncbi:peptidoglycan glycosyltransferase/peptidoglycan DD-transpeptidase MrcB [Gammaproteobacteria bacterium]